MPTLAPGAPAFGPPSAWPPDQSEGGVRGPPTRQPTQRPSIPPDPVSGGPAHGGRSPVSKRHQSNRRKAYGRRQHELSERRSRNRQPDIVDFGLDDLAPGGMADRFAFLDPRTPRLRFAVGD